MTEPMAELSARDAETQARRSRARERQVLRHERKLQIVSLTRAGASREAVARQLGVSVMVVSRTLKQAYAEMDAHYKELAPFALAQELHRVEGVILDMEAGKRKGSASAAMVVLHAIKLKLQLLGVTGAQDPQWAGAEADADLGGLTLAELGERLEALRRALGGEGASPQDVIDVTPTASQASPGAPLALTAGDDVDQMQADARLAAYELELKAREEKRERLLGSMGTHGGNGKPNGKG